jgi:hypothetical protein
MLNRHSIHPARMVGRSRMAQQKEGRTTNIAPWIGAGVLSASLLKSITDRVTEMRATKPKINIPEQAQAWRTRIEGQIPVAQQQIGHLSQTVGERLSEIPVRVQRVAPTRWSRRAWWGAGIGFGFAIVGTLTFILVRHRMQRESEQELVQLPATSNGHRPTKGNLRSVVNNLIRREQPIATEGASANQLSGQAVATAVEQASYVGNVRTMVYHPADSDHLPAEENRIYFRSVEEAEEAGYHRAE